MPNWGFVTTIHRAIYRGTGGRLGARLAGLDMLLLTTTGRKSGEPRTLPLACFEDGDDLVVVASNGGQAADPAWWLNLQADPRASVQFRRERRLVRANRAEGAERERLWPWLKGRNPAYVKYERLTSREIPVVVLRTIGE